MSKGHFFPPAEKIKTKKTQFLYKPLLLKEKLIFTLNIKLMTF
nr:MAG TPA: hypothetical protein [Caudoviricetes sp.]